MCDRMNWAKLLTEKRFHASKEDSKEENGRSQFEKDIDRITFSSAFRRLGRKTQVHLLAKDDHIHTRLSHSLEVACVGRSLGVMVGQWLKEKKEDNFSEDFPPSKVGEIVEAACLAHDIGNPFFGHAAEDAIRKWFQEEIHGKKGSWGQHLKNVERRDLECFDGNAMAFRVVTYKEYYEGKGGMRLTYPTLGALLKYPWTSHFAEAKKFSCFKTEYNSFCEIAEKLGLIEKIRDRSESKAEYARHPLAYLVEAADDICYHVLDIEDAIQLKLVQKNYLKEHFREKLKNELKEYQNDLLYDVSVSWSIKNGLLRGKMIGCMIKEVVEVFQDHYDDIMQGKFNKNNLYSKTADGSVCSTLEHLYKKDENDKKDEGDKNDKNDENKSLADRIYRNDRNLPLELGAYGVLQTLLGTSMEAAHEIFESKNPSYKTKIIKKFIKQDKKDQFKDKRLYDIIMLFLDYVTGMTDGYATYINKQLLGIGN